MKKYLIFIACLLLASFARSENTKTLVNRRMMEDKTMVGLQAGVCLPMKIYDEKVVKMAVGGGLRGKYFGTNTFAFGFDFGIYTPKVEDFHVKDVMDSLKNSLAYEQRIGRMKDSAVQITGVSASAQYIPINLTFEFYLPSHALKNFRPYAALGIGLNLVNRRYNTTFDTPKTTELLLFEDRYKPSTNRGFVSINPTVGFLYTINELWNINVDLRYNALLTKPILSGALSFHVGVVWDLSFKYVR